MFPGRGGAAHAAEKFGVTHSVWSRYENANSLSYKTLQNLARFFKVKVADLFVVDYDVSQSTSQQNEPNNSLDTISAPPKSRRMKPRPAKVSSGCWWENDIQTWNVRGRAAANSRQGAEVIDTGYADDEVDPPEGLTLVVAEGDSMMPLILNGQYAMIDKSREGFEVNGGIVVVVTVDGDGTYETRIKRCYRQGDNYLFTSINKDGHEPFTVEAVRSRIWPVIGVWFAGKGKPPKENLK